MKSYSTNLNFPEIRRRTWANYHMKLFNPKLWEFWGDSLSQLPFRTPFRADLKVTAARTTLSPENTPDRRRSRNFPNRLQVGALEEIGTSRDQPFVHHSTSSIWNSDRQTVTPKMYSIRIGFLQVHR